MFMYAHTPLEGQSKVHNYATGGTPPAAPGIMPNPSANPPPIGSTPANVADNIDAKISEGEFVMPADVVKFYGLDHFQKLITKAKEGMMDMAHSGLIKGNGPVVPNSPSAVPPAPSSPSAAAPPGPTDKPIGAAAGGFFAPPGHPAHYANGGYQTYKVGGLVTPLPTFHSPMISAIIPHNTGIVHNGVKGPMKNGTSVTKLADGGFLSTDQTNNFSAGGMPGGIMTPYVAPTAPMTAQPDTYAAQQTQSLYPQQHGLMPAYS